MRISFDLDDTLILSGKNSSYEAPIRFPYSIFYKERLRKGTVNLFKELSSLGYELCVYTTSERSEKYIKKLFQLYGIKLRLVINQMLHQRIVQGDRKEIMPSKVPSRFGIDLHIDDDISVKQNGIQHGFNVLILSTDDNEWDKKVLDEARRIMKLKGSRVTANSQVRNADSSETKVNKELRE
jgi:hypothetical protein